jgi:hypothetical protein
MTKPLNDLLLDLHQLHEQITSLATPVCIDCPCPYHQAAESLAPSAPTPYNPPRHGTPGQEEP